MTSEEIIVQGDKYLADNTDLNKRIFKRLIKYLSENTVQGKIMMSAQDLAVLEDIIYEQVKESDYEENISKYLELITALDNAISKEQFERNRIKAQSIKDMWTSEQQRTVMIEKVVYDLGQNGLKEYFVKGISEVVRDANFFNLTLSDAVEQLQKVLVDDDYTTRYIRGTAGDALAEYAGAIEDKVAEVYELNTMLYIGNVIETSRPICDHIRDDLRGRVSREKLKQVLNEYCPNGKPSQQYIQYSTVSGEKYRAKKGAGMKEGTRIDNFSQLRGGWGCRHKAVWVR